MRASFLMGNGKAGLRRRIYCGVNHAKGNDSGNNEEKRGAKMGRARG